MIASSLQEADETVGLLLKKGADVNSKSKLFSPAPPQLTDLSKSFWNHDLLITKPLKLQITAVKYVPP